MSSPFAAGRSIHIVGCAGAGMSALARFMAERGCVVSGCDAQASEVLDELTAAGVAIEVGHRSSHVDGVDFLTASPAVANSHVELDAARTRGVVVLNRAEMMGELSEQFRVVGIAGTHGKTTTTSMAAHIWTAAGLDPSWLIGTAVRGLGPGGHCAGDGDLLVEVDESYGTFAHMRCASLGVLNVDADHLDFYGELATLQAAFVALVERTKGPVVVWSDHSGAARVAEAAQLSKGQLWRVGRHHDSDVRVVDELYDRSGSRFGLLSPRGETRIQLFVPGGLNVENAAVAGALALANGVDLEAVSKGLGRFRGAPRRFETVATFANTVVIDDYAHLPAEVRATIDAARVSGFERIAALFQPHRITRTVALHHEFAGAFAGVTDLVITNIYSAGEPNPGGVTGELVADAVRNGPHAPRVTYADTLEQAAHQLSDLVGLVDLILILGAGDVTRVVKMMSELVVP